MREVITVRTNDWLAFRAENIGSMEIDTAKFKIYDGILNLSWGKLSDNSKKFFKNCDSIISCIENGKLTYQQGYGSFDQLLKYAPAIGDDSKVVFTEKEVC